MYSGLIILAVTTFANLCIATDYGQTRPAHYPHQTTLGQKTSEPPQEVGLRNKIHDSEYSPGNEDGSGRYQNRAPQDSNPQPESKLRYKRGYYSPDNTGSTGHQKPVPQNTIRPTPNFEPQLHHGEKKTFNYGNISITVTHKPEP